MGSSVIMGSKTFNTLSKELQGREVIVANRNDNPNEIINRISSKKCGAGYGDYNF